MNKSRKWKNILNSKKHIILHVTILCLLTYFIFHSIVGNRGIISYFQLSQNLEKSEKILDMLKADRIDINHKVDLLKKTIDLDMLDEQARKVLGLAKAKETVHKGKTNY